MGCLAAWHTCSRGSHRGETEALSGRRSRQAWVARADCVRVALEAGLGAVGAGTVGASRWIFGALITLPAQLASRGAAAGGMGGTPSGADSSRLARRRVGASSGRPPGMGGAHAPRARSAGCPPKALVGRGDLGGWWHLVGRGVGWTTAPCPQSPGLTGPNWLETLLNAVGGGRRPARGVWAWWSPPLEPGHRCGWALREGPREWLGPPSSPSISQHLPSSPGS